MSDSGPDKESKGEAEEAPELPEVRGWLCPIRGMKGDSKPVPESAGQL
jgi:hypothetical protein